MDQRKDRQREAAPPETVNEDRRAFLNTYGKAALLAPPVITGLLATSMSSPAIARSVGGSGGGGGGGAGAILLGAGAAGGVVPLVAAGAPRAVPAPVAAPAPPVAVELAPAPPPPPPPPQIVPGPERG